jgi:hypothetical protein
MGKNLYGNEKGAYFWYSNQDGLFDVWQRTGHHEVKWLAHRVDFDEAVRVVDAAEESTFEVKQTNDVVESDVKTEEETKVVSPPTVEKVEKTVIVEKESDSDLDKITTDLEW